MVKFRFAGFKFLVIFYLIRRNYSSSTISACKQNIKVSVILFQHIQIMLWVILPKDLNYLFITHNKKMISGVKHLL